jgi:hypothetical protein
MAKGDYSNMSLLYDEKGNPVPVGSPDTDGTIKITTGTATTDPISETVITCVELNTDIDSYISIGETPVASDATMPLWANQPRQFMIKPNEKIAISGGTLWITPYRSLND